MTNISPEYQIVLDHVRALYGEPYDTTDLATIIAQSRARSRLFALVGGVVPTLAATTRVVPVDAGGVAAEWVCADGARDDVRLLWVHGGGWVCGDAETYRPLTEALSEATAAAVLAIDYRLAPEHPYPAGLDDCQTAWRWMRENGPGGERAARTAWAAGDSAGGNLLLALAHKLRDEDGVLPDAIATIGAATDLTGASPSITERADLDPELTPEAVAFLSDVYAGGNERTDPYLSPLHGDLAGFPPTFMTVGEWELLHDDTTRFADKAHAAGAPVNARVWPGMIHVFEIFVQHLPQARASVSEIGAFLKTHGG